MIELLMDLCLAGQPDRCAAHLLPVPCVEAAARDWVAARPELVLRGWSCADPAARPALDVTEVAPGVFVHPGRQELADPENAGDEANLGFVIGAAGVAVIDAGGSRQVAEGLYAAIRARTDLPVKWLVLTHMHPDHTLGAEFFHEAGARIIGHARLPDALLNRSDSYAAAAARAMGPLVGLGAGTVLPDETVEESRDLDLGGRALRLEAWPTAHTDNDLTARDLATDTWFTGDLVFDRQTPSMDGSVLGWLRLLDELGAKPAARIVPGHGAASLPWPAGAETTRAYFTALVAETRAALARGESLGEASRHLGADLRGDWLLFDDFNARNATAVYRELEWE
ncbi:quinoprotein relay system zinc metallohydrolase 2 [Amaricoccus solimangrovi]|uniref:Quinoprotein relay system zinc metallohydrolase 2 n=1 Tax=Amaricoccus solimangrovi TaxID=2589815 RepID=A0A501WV09_9RHOB|nr:quinoprotein relay system zinc metallohydrolase 2 [Amaricoccus solimangrovi]TPE52145.1 quinoprotein relay system zinc metallohydrolase 2 [Amaricoccus solimangrovi]